MKDITQIKQAKRTLRHGRVRARVSGTMLRPRLSVFRSNKAVFVQLIDDVSGKTLASAHSKEIAKGTKTEKSAELGKLIAKKATEKGITKVVFDRGGYLYHGRVKAIADAAREAGLVF